MFSISKPGSFTIFSHDPKGGDAVMQIITPQARQLK